MRRRIGRPGLVGTMARTAVVAGTATAVVGGVNQRAQGRAQAQADQQATSAEVAAMQAELAGLAGGAGSSPAGGEGDDLASQLDRLADLKSRGMLSDSEFAAAKRSLLES